MKDTDGTGRGCGWGGDGTEVRTGDGMGRDGMEVHEYLNKTGEPVHAIWVVVHSEPGRA